MVSKGSYAVDKKITVYILGGVEEFMVKFLGIASVAILLQGCMGDLQEWRIERSTKRCEAYGFERNTSEIRQCIANDRSSRRTQQVIRNQMLLYGND